MQWIKANERLPENRKKWYVFRQSNNSRSAQTAWLEHAGNNIEGFFKLPLTNLEWLDESESPPTPVSLEEAAKGWAKINYAKAHKQKADDAEYVQAVAENSFLAGAAHAQNNSASLLHIGIVEEEDAKDFELLEEYDMKDKLEKTITHCLTKMPEENRKTFITNLCNGMIGSAILHFNNRYVKKLIVPDFKTTFK